MGWLQSGRLLALRQSCLPIHWLDRARRNMVENSDKRPIENCSHLQIHFVPAFSVFEAFLVALAHLNTNVHALLCSGPRAAV